MAISTGRRTLVGKTLILMSCLTAVFVTLTGYLIHELMERSSHSSALVDSHFAVADVSEQLIQELVVILENKRRYQILNDEEEWLNYQQAFSEYGTTLERFIKERPEQEQPWQGLYDQYARGMITEGGQLRMALRDDQALLSWIQRISEVKEKNQLQMENRLKRLSENNSVALNLGIIGGVLMLLIGPFGGFVLARRVSRRIDYLTDWADGLEPGRHSSVHLDSGDELSDLASSLETSIARMNRNRHLIKGLMCQVNDEMIISMEVLEQTLERLSWCLEDADPQTLKFLKIAQREKNKISMLQTRFFDHRCKSDRLPLEMSPVYIESLLMATLGVFRDRIEAKGVDLTMELDSGNQQVLVDEEYVKRILETIFQYVVDSSPEENGLHISSFNASLETLRIEIIRLGRSVPENDIVLKFNGLALGNHSRSDNDGGITWEMAVRIVQIFGGSLRFRNDFERGTLFIIELPVLESYP